MKEKKHKVPLTAQRRRMILERLREAGQVKTSELSELFGVSSMTIRNDLNALSAAGALVRTHGGAVTNMPLANEPSYKDKEARHSAEKARIGRAAARHLEDGMVVFIGNGTTTMQLIRALGPRRLRVFTNAINHAGALLEKDGVEVYVVGGYLRSVSLGMVGGLARRALEGIYFDLALIGVNGISLEHGFTLPSLEEAEIMAEVVHRAQSTIVLADHSKFGVVTHGRLAGLEDVERIITDRAPPPPLKRALNELEIELEIVGG